MHEKEESNLIFLQKAIYMLVLHHSSLFLSAVGDNAIVKEASLAYFYTSKCNQTQSYHEAKAYCKQLLNSTRLADFAEEEDPKAALHLVLKKLAQCM